MMRQFREICFDKGADVPNSGLPVLIYRAVLPSHRAHKADAFRKSFQAAGWSGVWTDTIYDYTHFHSNAHEVLGIAEGSVTLRLGGEAGSLFRLKAGDMIVLPAGVGHRRVGNDDGLKVIGAYPRGQSHFDMKRQGRVVPRVSLPSTDPFYGVDGPLMQSWSWEKADSRRKRPDR
jgi:uncharacterized protein YjlB